MSRESTIPGKGSGPNSLMRFTLAELVLIFVILGVLAGDEVITVDLTHFNTVLDRFLSLQVSRVSNLNFSGIWGLHMFMWATREDFKHITRALEPS